MEPLGVEPTDPDDLIGYLRQRIANLELDVAMARAELQRNKKARLNWQNETNAVMGSIRSAFGVPDDVPLTAFAEWLKAELQRRENQYRAQFKRRIKHEQFQPPARCEADAATDQGLPAGEPQ